MKPSLQSLEEQRELERVFPQRESGAATGRVGQHRDALVAIGKLILCLKSIEDSKGQIEARLVAMGNVLFDKHMSVRRDAALHDLWSPVASTAEARIVRFCPIWSRFYYELRWLVNHEQMAHCSRSASPSCVVA